MISPAGVQLERVVSPASPLLQSAPGPREQQDPADSSSEPCSSSTSTRAEASLAAAAAATSTSQTSPAEGGAGGRAVAGGPAASSAQHPCGRAGWRPAHAQQAGAAASTASMPPADPGRSGSHVAATGLMLQEQRSQLASLQLAGTATPQVVAAEAGAGLTPGASHTAGQSSTAAAAAEAGKQQRQQSAATDSKQQQLLATDSEDDSWSPSQPQSSSGEGEQAEDTTPAHETASPAASAGGSSDGHVDSAAAYGYSEEGEEAEGAENEAAWEAHMPPPVYCTNCTARLYVSEQHCSDCGHSNEQDSELLTCTAVSPEQPSTSAAAAASSAAAAGDCPLIIWDDSMLLHEEGKHEPHPERPDRLRAVVAQLQGNGLTGLCQRIPARLATKQELLRVHTPDHLHRLQLFCSGAVPPSAIPSDTYINQHTLQCAALAAGSAAEVAVRVWQGEGTAGAAIIRPPGHHAESNTAMGFCFFNNAAVAARAVQAAGASRVLILDWDVHHGNGTQHIFEQDDTVLYMSLHRHDRGTFYPGTGAACEVGEGPGEGYTVNVPWDTDGVSDGDYMAAMEQVVLPIAREFAPDMILISAGFDAAAGDPIGGCNLTPDCFGAMTAALMPIAPTVLLLEGGYNLRSTALSTEACLRVLLGEPAPELEHSSPSPYAWFSIQATRKAHSKHWSCLAGLLPPLEMHFPAGRGATAAAAGRGGGDCGGSLQPQEQQQQQGSEGLELQYEDEYEEAEYSEGDEGEFEEGEEGYGEEGEEEYGEEEGEEGEEEEEFVDAAAGGDAEGDVDVAFTDADNAEAAAATLQQQQQGLAGPAAVAGVSSSSGGGRRQAGVKRGVDDVDAGGRRVRFATPPAAAALEFAHEGPHQQQQRRLVLQPASGSTAAVRPVMGHRRPGSSGSGSRQFGRSSSSSSRPVGLRRRDMLLRAIHNRAMRLFLRKQRELAVRASQQQQQQQQQP